VPAFPTYGPDLTAALDEQANAILNVFTSRGYARHESSVLQPADIFLDRSGEEIRRRTFELTDPSGRELCLRPDLTIPACKWQVESGNPYPARLCYNGLVFRHQPAERVVVVLVEQFANAARVAEIVPKLSRQAAPRCGARRRSRCIRDEDRRSRVFSTLIDALDVPAQWRGRLKRHFWRKGYFLRRCCRV
jgi:ATP phosphoribosyltransferase regulatory subunit